MEENSALLDKALLGALHSMAGSEERWRKRLKAPMADAALLGAVSYEFGSMGGFMGSGMAYNYRGGTSPEFSLGFTGDKVTLKGKALIAAVRRVLGLDYKQLELPMEAAKA